MNFCEENLFYKSAMNTDNVGVCITRTCTLRGLGFLLTGGAPLFKEKSATILDPHTTSALDGFKRPYYTLNPAPLKPKTLVAKCSPCPVPSTIGMNKPLLGLCAS